MFIKALLTNTSYCIAILYLQHPSLGSSDDLSPRSSPRASPRKQLATSPKVAPHDVLKTLFDSSSQDMSAFRVLYNLEVSLSV